MGSSYSAPRVLADSTCKHSNDQSTNDDRAPNISTTNSQPFRFLDLPKELRLIVYEHLPITTRHIKFHLERTYENEEGTAFLVTKSFPVAILSVCHQIHAEASKIVRAKLDNMYGPAKIIIHYNDVAALASSAAAGYLIETIYIYGRREKAVAHSTTCISIHDRCRLLNYIERGRLYQKQRRRPPIWPDEPQADFQIAIVDSAPWDGNEWTTDHDLLWRFEHYNPIRVELCVLERDLLLAQADRVASTAEDDVGEKLEFLESVELFRTGMINENGYCSVLPGKVLTSRQWEEGWLEGDHI